MRKTNFYQLAMLTIISIITLGVSTPTLAQGKTLSKQLAFNNLFTSFSQNPILTGNFTNLLAQDDQYPKPDTTVWDKYYEVVKYEYKIISDGKLYFILKPKSEDGPSGWLINFYDADGVQVISEMFVIPMSADHKVGRPEKYYAYTPGEVAMKRVKEVIVTRHIY